MANNNTRRASPLRTPFIRCSSDETEATMVNFQNLRSSQKTIIALTLIIIGAYVFLNYPVRTVTAGEVTDEPTPSETWESESPSPTPEESIITTPECTPEATPEVTPEPTPEYTSTPSPTPMPMGSITVCKIIVDSENNVVDGSAAAGTTFEVVSISPNSSLGAPVGMFGSAPFTAPLSYNADLLSGFPGNDSQCTTFSSLLLGSYYYSEETISDASNWLTPLYNDQFTVPVLSLNDFFPYDSNLFDGNASNDLDRNQNVDGHIVLTPERTDRTLVILNQLISEGGVGGCPDCVTPTPSPTPSDSPTPTPNNGGGGSGNNGGGSNTPTPTLSASPTPDTEGNSGGGSGGGGGSTGTPITPAPTPMINGASITPTPTPGVGGAMDELPATSLESFDSAIMISFVFLVLWGLFLVLRGSGYIVHEKI